MFYAYLRPKEGQNHGIIRRLVTCSHLAICCKEGDCEDGIPLSEVRELVELVRSSSWTAAADALPEERVEASDDRGSLGEVTLSGRGSS